jgi:hypothetical protein
MIRNVLVKQGRTAEALREIGNNVINAAVTIPPSGFVVNREWAGTKTLQSTANQRILRQCIKIAEKRKATTA